MGDALVHLSKPQVVRLIETAFAAFDAAFAAAPYVVTRTIAGRRVQIATTVPGHQTLAQTRLADGGNGAGQDLRLLVICGGEMGMPVAPDWPIGRLDPRLVESALDHSRWKLHVYPETKFWQMWDTQRSVGIQLMADPDSAPKWESGAPLRNLLRWGLAHEDQDLIHAGTLGLYGRGLLIVGQGGAGKSGTVLAGLISGLQSVGDDYVLVSIADKGLTAKPVFQSLKVDPKGAQWLGIQHHVSGDVNWQGKHEFTFTDLTGAPPHSGLDIVALCHPAIVHGDKTTFVPISQKEAFLALAPTGVTQLPGNRSRSFAFAARITRRVPCFRLNLGRDPAEISAAILTALKDPAWPC